MLRDSLLKFKNVKDKARICWEFYESRKLLNDMEPTWTHLAYQAIKEYLDGDMQNKEFVAEIVHSHELADGSTVSSFPGIPNSPRRVLHDGWKIGTPTWVFMGRNEHGAATRINEKWVAVKRIIPDQIFKENFSNDLPRDVWIAYNINKQMGTTASTANCIGPAFSYEQLVGEIQQMD